MKRQLILIPALISVALLLAGCAGTDVILKYAPDAFQRILDASPGALTDTTRQDTYYEYTVDGMTMLKISGDYSKTGEEDLVIATPLQPFTDAGLDASALGGGYRADGTTLYLTGSYGGGTGAKASAADALLEAVAADRSNLSYHQKLDHYGVRLQNGVFEWARDHKTNDKDIVFVLYAKPLQDFGVNVNTIEGWSFMTADNSDGSTTDLLVKPFSLN